MNTCELADVTSEPVSPRHKNVRNPLIQIEEILLLVKIFSIWT